jgi:SAM-dependent methyltransferase
VSDGWLDANRAMWDERVPIHLRSTFYDVDAFLSGADTVRPFERDEVGDVRGRSLVHLQCHFGLDTLSWARLGARVVGLDFSEPAIEAARRLAADSGLDATFVVGDVYEAPEVLEHRRFDVVYTGFGALNWLPDIERWAGVVASLVEPGGFLYLAEFHPFSDVFGEHDLTVQFPYFHADPIVWDDESTYADPSAVMQHVRSYEWIHPIGEVVSALVDAGLTIELLRERDLTLFQRWPFLVRHDDGTYRLPAGMPSLPLLYTLRARRPASPPDEAIGSGR